MLFNYQWVTDETRKRKFTLKKLETMQLKLTDETRPRLRSICSDKCLYHRRVKITAKLRLLLKGLTGERCIRMTFPSSKQSVSNTNKNDTLLMSLFGFLARHIFCISDLAFSRGHSLVILHFTLLFDSKSHFLLQCFRLLRRHRTL